MRKTLKIASGIIREYKKQLSRSHEWPATRRRYLINHNSCEACGGTKLLQVHHKKPFHLFPELELDQTNLITLCQWNLCHLYLGHGDHWDYYVPNVSELAQEYLHSNDGYKTELVKQAENLRTKQ